VKRNKREKVLNKCERMVNKYEITNNTRALQEILGMEGCIGTTQNKTKTLLRMILDQYEVMRFYVR
jgi:hypothetical protein